MKRYYLLLSILCLMLCPMGVEAQTWKMVITMSDGSQQEVSTADIKDIQYVQQMPRLEDRNVDQIIIKELYNGGVMLDDGSTHFQFDKCIILYNNCPQQAVANNLCIGMAAPANAQAQNNNYGTDGRLKYEKDKFIPAWNGIWYFPFSLVIEPYSQVVVNICGAIDNTPTVSQSINYANADYYCMYDPESGYNHTSYYPTPSAVIPTSHYLKAVRYAQGNGWPFSMSSPAVILFQTQEVTPDVFATTADNYWYDGDKTDQIHTCVKVPNDWILDGMEVYAMEKPDDCKKRLTADIDAGYVGRTNKMGHSLYRNVDKEFTESLPENSGKLVYGSTTDPSGIDAEASIAAGAHIVYLDTNNSTADFHERPKCSLRD